MTIHKPFSRQRGAALFVSLMFLIILTLLGISAANVGIMQERMAGNVRETNEAFQLAEATLREIEQRLVEIGEGGSGGLGEIPVWAEALDTLGIDRFDCTLTQAGNLPWNSAPTTGNDYYVVELTDSITASGEVLVWQPKSKETHSAQRLFRLELTLDDGIVAQIDKLNGWN